MVAIKITLYICSAFLFEHLLRVHAFNPLVIVSTKLTSVPLLISNFTTNTILIMVDLSCHSAGVLYSNYATSQTPGDSSGISPKSPAFTLQRLLTSGIYFPLSEAVVMFYQVSS